MQITITQRGCLSDFFLQTGIEKLPVWLWIEPITLDLSLQSGAFDPSAMVTPRWSTTFKEGSIRDLTTPN